MAAQPRILTSIQAARGAAALAVVLCHAGTVLGDPFGGALRAGHAGVDFFFVLSGFIIATVHRDDLGRAASLPSYARKRLVRIYPVYCIATSIALGLWWLGVVPLSNVSPDGVAISLLLLPQHVEPTLGVAWTLQHEMLFYVAFGFLILNRKAGVSVFAVWALFIVAQLPAAPPDLPWAHADLLTGFVGSSYNLEFGLGIVVAMVAAWYRTPCPVVLAAIGVVGLLLTAAAEDVGAIFYLGRVGQALFGTSSALVVWGLAATERTGSLRAGRFLVFIGSASYAIYLIHVPVLISVASLTAVKLLPAWVSVAVLATIGMGGGAALHVVAERPVLRALRPRALALMRYSQLSGPGVIR
jgi:exopolysaccharide production protein ExoZ